MTDKKKIDVCAEDVEASLRPKNATERLKEYHDDKLRLFGLNHWDGFPCSNCKAETTLVGLRSLEVRLHAKDFGDIVAEILCQECHCINRIHFCKKAQNVEDFTEFLSNTRPQDLDSISEAELVCMRYNNLMDEMMAEEREDKNEHD